MKVARTLASLLWLWGPWAAHAGDTAEVLLRRGDFDAALEAATSAAEARPDDVEAQELLIDIMLSLGLQPKAEREAKARVAAHPTDPDAHYLLGRARVDPAGSRSAYEAALRLDPEHARANMGMGSLHEALGRPAEAAAAYARASSRDATLGEAWLGQVRALLLQGKAPQALAVARQGVAAAPDEAGLALVVAELDPGAAEAELRAALQRVGPEARLHEALAAVLLTKGDGPGSAEQASAALQLDPTLLDARRSLLFARELSSSRLVAADVARLDEARRLESTDAAAALARYAELVSRNPKSSLVLLGRAAARRASGDRAGALDDLKAAAALDPQNDEAAAVAGLALLEVGQGAAAAPLLRTAYEARPWDGSLALALARAVPPAERLPLLGQIASALPLDVDVQLHYAQALIDARRFPEAYGVLKVSMNVLPDPRLVAAFIQVAPLAGHPGEAADVLEPVAQQTNNEGLKEAVRRLRERAKAP